MKKFKLHFISMALVLICACSAEDSTTSTTNAKVDGDGLAKALSNYKRASNSGILFTYSTVEEAVEGQLKIVDLAIESRASIKDVADCEGVLHKVRLNEGKAILEEIHYLNDKDEILLSYVYDASKDEYITYSNGQGPIFEASLTACPTGWSSLASCSNFTTENVFMSCMGNAQATFMNQTLTGAGSCAQLQFSVTATATNICGKSC